MKQSYPQIQNNFRKVMPIAFLLSQQQKKMKKNKTEAEKLCLKNYKPENHCRLNYHLVK